MLNTGIIKSKYGEDSKKLFLSVQDILLAEPEDKKTIEKSKDIAKILIDLKLDIDSVCAGLIYPFILKNPELLEKFAEFTSVSKILKSLQIVDFYSKDYTDPNGLKEMLIAITKDVRVVIVKSVQILIEAREGVQKVNNEDAKHLFRVIDDIYAPIAARLGISEIKSELQDLSFEFNHQEEWTKLKYEVAHESRANDHMINKIVTTIKTLLKKNNVDCICYGRIKHLSSIYKKITEKNTTLKNIYDIAAARIIVKNISECYAALGIVHSSFTPVDGRFKDYIAHPKTNGYQSLHTTIYFQGEFFEIQIRTEKMHEFAEYGVAAHFLYKENKKSLAGLDTKLLEIRKILENIDDASSEKILKELSTDVYVGEIFVQTPKGKVIKLIENATPIDFAYAIHSDIGNMCVGAKVNGTMVPITSTLSNGDVVEIITSQNSKGPSKDWLKKAKMPSTREKINYFFKKQMKDSNIKLGKTMIEQFAKSNDIILSSLLKEKYINVLLKKGAFLNFDEICAGVGYGSLSAERVVRRLQTLKNQDDQKSKTILSELPNSEVKLDDKSSISGVQGALTKYCKGCNPIPGDKIVGYVSRGRGIIIHRCDCESLSSLSKSRFVKVDWNMEKVADSSFVSSIDIVAKENSSIYVESQMRLVNLI
ncbi:MAG: bifunctional (p)ppGpp synthetase/guanosine-3',5'-bis(diphosphate) 3'-pyrophosphohydrolase [Clostridia bacterium]|nr:bifunctional (p)ppGpp synthetase/guanosine-3',5'-bis(diphosphate) 3'-pyrophosphohydrolase [Clostridia bacterium]